MRVLVYEFLCATADQSLPASLAREGRAMLAAVVEDFARIPDVVVCTLWAESLGPPPFLSDLPIQTIPVPMGNEAAVFQETARVCDVAFVIAPESDSLLAQRFEWISRTSCRWLGSSLPAIALCTDKLALANHLSECGVSTIPTKSWNASRSSELDLTFPAVIKPRDGAGSQATYLVRDVADYRRLLPTLVAEPALQGNAIHQPYIPGEAVSVAVLISADGSTAIPLPVCRQHLTGDGRFHYLGGSVPADINSPEVIQRTALDACRHVPGLTGYAGVDLVIPESTPNQPLVVEINPRLTTSYLGYRRLTSNNLGEWLLGSPTFSPNWKRGHVEFEPN